MHHRVSLHEPPPYGRLKRANGQTDDVDAMFDGDYAQYQVKPIANNVEHRRYELRNYYDHEKLATTRGYVLR